MATPITDLSEFYEAFKVFGTVFTKLEFNNKTKNFEQQVIPMNEVLDPNFVSLQNTKIVVPDLSEKALDFIEFIKTADRALVGAAIGKIKVLGEENFLYLVPFLASDKMRKTLLIQDPPTTVDIRTQGMLEFAATMGINENYIHNVYRKYLRTKMV